MWTSLNDRHLLRASAFLTWKELDFAGRSCKRWHQTINLKKKVVALPDSFRRRNLFTAGPFVGYISSMPLFQLNIWNFLNGGKVRSIPVSGKLVRYASDNASALIFLLSDPRREETSLLALNFDLQQLLFLKESDFTSEDTIMSFQMPTLVMALGKSMTIYPDVRTTREIKIKIEEKWSRVTTVVSGNGYFATHDSMGRVTIWNSEGLILFTHYQTNVDLGVSSLGLVLASKIFPRIDLLKGKNSMRSRKIRGDKGINDLITSPTSSMMAIKINKCIYLRVVLGGVFLNIGRTRLEPLCFTDQLDKTFFICVDNETREIHYWQFPRSY